MPPDRRPRQDPVSCETCRRKKLKCDREYPCSNCKARGASCVFSGKRAPSTTAQQTHHPDETTALRAENSAIKHRLEKLESFVYGSQPYTIPAVKEAQRSDPGQTVLPSPSSSTPAAPAETPASKGCREDYLWLEGVGTEENTRLPRLSPTFRIRVERIEEIVKNTGLYDERDIPLPTAEEASMIVDVYATRIDPAQHFTHVPTYKESFARLYDDLSAGRIAEPNRTVLLLSILTSVAAYWAYSPDDIPFYRSKKRALDAAYDWTRITLNVLEHVRRTGTATLETIQAHIVIVFFIYHADGFSLKVRALHASAIMVAKELGLHRTDAPRNGLPLPRTQADIIDRELRRRIWWHLACTDWSLGTAGSTHAGTYLVSPKHMRVLKPRNVSDEELSTMPADWERPLSEPTVMSYFMMRIQLGEISRHIADLDSMQEMDHVSVGEIVAIDKQFELALNGLPAFLRIDEESIRTTRHLEAEHPHLPLQRYIVNVMLQARRCKFHGPFLLRSATDASYDPFRLECLHAARAVIKARHQLATDGNFMWLANSKMSGVLHLFFYAVVVLLIDLCVNRAAGDEEARKAEIQEACKTLEEARQQSVPAAMYLNSLMAIMRKHQIRLQGQEMPGAESLSAPTGSISVPPQPSLVPGEASDGYGLSLDFDEIWQSYTSLDFGDAQYWDDLMRDLDFTQ